MGFGFPKGKTYASDVLLRGIMESYVNEKEDMAVREKKLKKIRDKFAVGVKLTGKEMRFLAGADSSTYQKVRAVAAQRAALEEAMKHAKTKEEAERLFEGAMGTVGKPGEDEMAEAKLHQFEAAKREFQKESAGRICKKSAPQSQEISQDLARQLRQLEGLAEEV